MSFITKTSVLRRTLILVLFLVSMLGPWMFDLINVPAQYTCDKPFVRLYGDFCGYPLSGFEAIKWLGGGLFYTLGELVKGNLVSQTPDLIVLTCILILVLPFFSMLLLAMNQNSRRLQAINVIAWGLACLLALTVFILQAQRDQFAQFFFWLWGLWLYILLAAGTIACEVRICLKNNTPGGSGFSQFAVKY